MKNNFNLIGLLTTDIEDEIIDKLQDKINLLSSAYSFKCDLATKTFELNSYVPEEDTTEFIYLIKNMKKLIVTLLSSNGTKLHTEYFLINTIENIEFDFDSRDVIPATVCIRGIYN